MENQPCIQSNKKGVDNSYSEQDRKEENKLLLRLFRFIFISYVSQKSYMLPYFSKIFPLIVALNYIKSFLRVIAGNGDRFLLASCFGLPSLCLISEAVLQKCSVKKLFFKTWQKLQKNTCVRVSFLIRLQV